MHETQQYIGYPTNQYSIILVDSDVADLRLNAKPELRKMIDNIDYFETVLLNIYNLDNIDGGLYNTTIMDECTLYDEHMPKLDMNKTPEYYAKWIECKWLLHKKYKQYVTETINTELLVNEKEQQIISALLGKIGQTNVEAYGWKII
jgi:hypothetical protein